MLILAASLTHTTVEGRPLNLVYGNSCFHTIAQTLLLWLIFPFEAWIFMFSLTEVGGKIL